MRKGKKLIRQISALILAIILFSGSLASDAPIYAAGNSFISIDEGDETAVDEHEGFIDATGESTSIMPDNDAQNVENTDHENDFIDDTDENGNGDDSSVDLVSGDDFYTHSDDSPDNLYDSTVSLEASAAGIGVVISGDSNALGNAASLSIQEVSSAESAACQSLMEECSEVLAVYDISLMDADGCETEPSGTVEVTMYGDLIKENSNKGGSLEIVHFVDINGSDSISTFRQDMSQEDFFEVLNAEVLSGDTLVFETESFSKYALVLTGNDSQKEIHLSGEKYFEIDKYLSAPTGELNGQKTYDTYLEHAYYDGTQPHPIINYAPAEQDIILVLDQSASMGDGTRVDAINKSTETFVRNIMVINNYRMKLAEEGAYTDIDPEGDIESQMKNHLMRITGIIGFNNRTYDKYHNQDGLAVLTNSDINTLVKAGTIKDDYREYWQNGNTNTDLQDCTRTDLALAKAKSWINQSNYENTNIVLVTDGAPYGGGSEGKASYDYESSEFLMMSAPISNDALRTARQMKDNGATIYCVYLGYGDVGDLNGAFSTGDISYVPCWSNHPSIHITSVFLSLVSSDYPKNGNLGYSSKSNGNLTYPFDYTYTFGSDPRNHFGKYIYLPDKVDQMMQDIATIPGYIDASSSNNKRGYAGATATVHDEVTDPFDITDPAEVRVYKVPRIPVNIGEDGIPVDADGDGIVSEFRWGEQYIIENGTTATEWVEITNEAGIVTTVKNNIVEVLGFDYELNAVTDYDKDLYKAHPPADAAVYEEGDYGYKLVAKIPINAKVTFGGNDIETNNSETSAFFPSDPIGYQDTDPEGEDYLPKWVDNKELNPDGNKYVEMYPVPYVDLEVNYKIPSDSILIYAPQTAELANLVTDIHNNMWYVDGQYFSLKTARDNSYTDFVNSAAAYNKAMQEAAKDPENEVKMKAVATALSAYSAARLNYEAAQEAFDSVESYIPDGLNNQFVDINYKLKDPDGTVVGTLDIPHGKAYTVKNGVGNISWNFTADGTTKTNIVKSGKYTIECTVTPVDTVRAPGGHVATEADSDAVQGTIPYKSTEYSSTGSSAAGPQTALTIKKEPTAHIFQLHVNAVDTRLQKGQALDFNQGNENLISTDNVHIAKYEWVCTDGVTKSQKINEPGVNGSLVIGGGVVVTSQIPKQAEDEGKVRDVMGTTVVNVGDGEYIPVSVILSRNTGKLDKSVSDKDQVTQMLSYMRTDDNIYGGLSSVVWEHGCEFAVNCDDNEFTDAQSYNTPETNTGRGTVRYLIHVLDNPVPDIKKETSTPGITKGEDIRWNIGLTNNNKNRNPKQRMSSSTMVDILPYVGDGRIDPGTNNEGSEFGGVLSYRSIAVEFKEGGAALDAYRNGKAKMYYTTGTAVRDADESQILGTSGKGDIKWTELSGTQNGNIVTFNGCPDNATALRLDTVLAWEEGVNISLSANLNDLSKQMSGDHYHNQAFVLNGDGVFNSEVVVTTVADLFISGTVWEDSDRNGMIGNSEPKIGSAIINLYKPYDPKNPGKIDRTVEGVQLVRAFDTDGNKFPSVLTPDDGTFLFENVSSGTYYIIADSIPDKYEMTVKQAGKGDINSEKLDSEAEVSFIPADTVEGQQSSKSAWIKKVEVASAGVPYQNFGLTGINGLIKVGKTLDEIYYPSSMTEDERNSYRVAFIFTLKNKQTGESYTQSMSLNKDTIHAIGGKPQVWAEFNGLPLGDYELSEVHNAQYEIKDVTSGNVGIQYDRGSQTITIPVTARESEVNVAVENKLKKDPPGGDQNRVRNLVGMHIPVSLEVKYVGKDPISDKDAVKYTFTSNDFKPRNGGDIIVTYDDGSKISLSEGTLDFSQLTFSPATVTNTNNSGKGKIPVTVFYTEKGRTVSDSFRVAVDLKPIHKFQLNFDANGSSFDDGSGRNSVMFGYDEISGGIFATNGVYKDIKNGGLNGRGNSYIFAGWNTKNDGSGVQYDDLSALNAIGMDSGISVLTLYANWKTQVTFDANGGMLAGGITDQEKAVSGKNKGSILYNVNQTAATGLLGSRENYTYVVWNTKADGTGINIDAYGNVSGPVTFYAIYYQSEYYYTGTEQTFIAPVNGWYKVQLWGAKGGDDDPKTGKGARGAYVSGEVHVTAGTKLYVYVGAPGRTAVTGTGAGYNGGGNPGASGWSGSGGGATDVRTTSGNWTDGLSSRIAVAAGGGGGGCYGDGGYGGALTGGSGGTKGGTQTSAGPGGRFGVGGTPTPDGGGGGGGWYGGGAGNDDVGGGGGSSYISGFPGCDLSWTGYVFKNPLMIAGNQEMPAPDGGTEIGHDGECRARIQLISLD